MGYFSAEVTANGRHVELLAHSNQGDNLNWGRFTFSLGAHKKK